MYKTDKMENKDQQNILLMAVAGIGLYLFFKKKSTLAPVVPPTTGGGNELQPIAPSPVYNAPVQPIYAPTEPVYIEPTQPIAPSPISTLPVLTNPILDIINIPPVQQTPAPVYTRPEPIYNFPVYETPVSELKGSIEVGPLDKGEYGGGNDYFVSTPSQPVYQPPIDIYIPPIAPAPELKGSIEVGELDKGQYGPAEDMPTDTEKPPITLSMFDNLLFNPQQSSGSGGGGGSASGGDFGGGGGGYGSGQNFLYDFIWYNPSPTLKGSIEVGNLDQGEFL